MTNNDIQKAKDGFWDKIKKVGSIVPFAQEAIAMFYAMIDSNTPAHAKAVLAGALVYFIVPIDVIPDFLGLPGYVDDAGIIMPSTLQATQLRITAPILRWSSMPSISIRIPPLYESINS